MQKSIAVLSFVTVCLCCIGVCPVPDLLLNVSVCLYVNLFRCYHVSVRFESFEGEMSQR